MAGTKTPERTLSMLDLLGDDERGSLRTRQIFGRLYLVDKKDQRKSMCPVCGTSVLDTYNTKDHQGWKVCTSCSWILTGAAKYRGGAYECPKCAQPYFQEPTTRVRVVESGKVSIEDQPSARLVCKRCEWWDELGVDDDDEDLDDDNDDVED